MKFILIFMFLGFSSCNNTGIKTQNIVIKKDKQSIQFKKNDTLMNNEKYLLIGNGVSDLKVVYEDSLKYYAEYDIIRRYKTEIIIGKLTKTNNTEFYIKYNPSKTFDDFKVEIYKGKLSPPNFNSNSKSKRYITRIKKGCENGINFAGFYTLVTWGCGSPCQGGAIINRKNGKIFMDYGTELGSEYKKDSKLIILNVGALNKKTNLIEFCAYCNVETRIWNGENLVSLE